MDATKDKNKNLAQYPGSGENLQLAAIQEVSEAIASRRSLTTILEVIAKAAVVTFEAPSSWIMIKENGLIKTLIARGRDRHILQEIDVNTRWDNILSKAWNEENVEIFLPGRLKKAGIFASLVKENEALILIPFGNRKGRLGILGCIIPQKLAVSIKFLVALAGQAAVGIQKADLFRKLADKNSENMKLLQKVEILNKEVAKSIKQEILWSNSPAMSEVYRLVERINSSPSTPVLLGGETGTGKELIARLIHYGTKERKKGLFLELNCASLSENLLESELFGHEKGSFTDARETKQGLLELAHQGTLFLDEIGDMNIRIQARLLRVLDNFTFRRVGGSKEIQVELRLVAATNKNLELEVERGNFRRDLFHRLQVISVIMPPLRERREDIIPLAEFFLAKFTKRLQKDITTILPETRDILFNYGYPGNIRELKNIIERGVIIENDSVLHPESLALPTVSIQTPIDLSTPLTSLPALNYSPPDQPTLKQVEKEHIKRILELTGRNKTKTSKLLGISYPTLDKKIKDYAL